MEEDKKQKQPTITELLKELMDAKDMSVERLAHTTDIPSRFIVSLLQEDFEKLPAQPYVRGYLFKVAEVLEIDPHILWQSYRQTTEVPTSGDQDFLPSNRFAIKRVNTSRLVFFFAVLVVVAFVGFRINSILGNPTIDLVLPEATSEEVITIAGGVRAGDSLTINDEVIYPDSEGTFRKEVRLEIGLNTFEFRVKRYLGKEQTFVRQVFYQPN